MPLKVSLTLLSLIVLVGIAFGAVQLYSIVTSEHDGWDIFAPVEATTEPLVVEPRNLLSRDDRESLNHVVTETRGYGIPWSIWVVSRDSLESDLSAEEIAAQRYAEQPVESTEGAGDGLLMVVVVPEPDHTATEVAFVTGPNFYPKGGITPERLDEIAEVQMAPLITDDNIGDAVIEGATWVEWTQLFQPAPDSPPSNLERGLQDLLSPLGAAAIAALAIIVLAAAVLVKAITWRGSGAATQPDLNGLLAAAAARGRVDRHVIAGAILNAVDRGAIAVDDRGLTAPAEPQEASKWDAKLRALVSDLQQGGEPVTPALLTRYLRHNGDLRRAIEDELARDGAFHPRSPVLTVWLRWIAAGGLLLGAIALVLAVIGESAPALTAGLALATISLVVLIWNERRSWTTRSGMRALAQWRATHDAPDDRERVLYETIMALETVDMEPSYQSPVRKTAQPLVGALNQ